LRDHLATLSHENSGRRVRPHGGGTVFGERRQCRRKRGAQGIAGIAGHYQHAENGGRGDAEPDLGRAVAREPPGEIGMCGALVADEKRGVARKQKAVRDEVARYGGGVDAQPKPDHHRCNERYRVLGEQRQCNKARGRAYHGAEDAIETLGDGGARRRLRDHVHGIDRPLRFLEVEPVADREGGDGREERADGKDDVLPAQVDRNVGPGTGANSRGTAHRWSILIPPGHRSEWKLHLKTRAVSLLHNRLGETAPPIVRRSSAQRAPRDGRVAA
jgi:hypothetical protein